MADIERIKVNLERSREIADKVPPLKKQCYRNCFLGQWYLPGSLYCEGYAINSNGLVFEHAWLEFEGEVIDPTLIGLFGKAAEFYVSAIKLTLEDMIDNDPMMDNRGLPIFLQSGIGGYTSPQMREANRKAYAYIGVQL